MNITCPINILIGNVPLISNVPIYQGYCPNYYLVANANVQESNKLPVSATVAYPFLGNFKYMYFLVYLIVKMGTNNDGNSCFAFYTGQPKFYDSFFHKSTDTTIGKAKDTGVNNGGIVKFEGHNFRCIIAFPTTGC